MLPSSTHQHASKPLVITEEYSWRIARDRFSQGTAQREDLKPEERTKKKSLVNTEVYGAHSNNKPQQW